MKRKIIKFLIPLLLFFIPLTASASDYGVDWSSYQGAYGKYSSNKSISFAFSKLGGDNYSYVSPVYSSQVQSGLNKGVRMHTYVWAENITSITEADYFTGKYLPMVQTPKDSIVAIDVEAGYVNNNAVIRMMDNIKAAGFTPMFYSYKPFIQSQGVDISRIVRKFGSSSIWIAGYPTREQGVDPLFAYFPSIEGAGIWQYSDNGTFGGLDMNIDLSGITKAGYDKGYTTPVVPAKPATPSVKPAERPSIKPNTYTVRSGDSLSSIAYKFGTSVNSIASLNGIYNVNLIYPGQVLKVSGTPVSSNTYTVRSGDSLSSIAYKLGTSVNSIASLNGIYNVNLIYPGQVLKVSGTSVNANTYTVRTGDTLSGIGYKLGVSYYTIAAKSGISVNSIIYPGQTLRF